MRSAIAIGLELRVERAFCEAGKALAELRERRLYRSTYKTFEAYCQDRFRFTCRHVNYLIAGSQVVENLQMGTNGEQILPTSERQVRSSIALQRIRRVREVPGFRDRAAYAMLEHMGKQTYLTPLEEKILQVIEREYGVEDVEPEVGS